MLFASSDDGFVLYKFTFKILNVITFDNQLSTGIQAFGHCGSPACCQTSAFGANPDAPAYSAEAQSKRGTASIIGLAVFVVAVSILFTGKLK